MDRLPELLRGEPFDHAHGPPTARAKLRYVVEGLEAWRKGERILRTVGVNEVEGNLRSNYEDWLTWIVLSLCGMLLLIGLVRGAVG